jgi:HK97 family phage prohead protease
MEPNQPETVPTVQTTEPGQPERRLIASLAEIREADKNPASRKFFGYAAKFGVVSRTLGYGNSKFVEVIQRGAFADTLKNAEEDTIFNLEHINRFILGRKSSGTVKIYEDERGLAVECEIPETTYGNDLLVSIRRKDIKFMSFAFLPTTEEWDMSVTPHKRTVKAARLFDVAAVIDPAYLQTTVSLRNMPTAEKQPITLADDDYLDLTIRLMEMDRR